MCARVLLLIAVSFLFGSCPVFGAEFLVATPGALGRAVSNAIPGDVIVLKNGEWPDTAIRLERSGTAEKPIVLRAETPGEAVMTGASSLDFAGDWLVVEGLRFEKLNTPRVFVVFEEGADHCRFSNSAILDSNNESRNWIHLRRGLSNRVDHCRFSGMSHRGVQMQIETERERPNYHRIDHNIFANRARGNGNGFETIRIGYSHQQWNFAGAQVDHNLFYKCDGENEIISNKSTGNRILNNTFLDNRGELTLRHGDKAWVEGNWFIGNNTPGSGGVRVIGSDHVVVNNYFSALRTYAILVRKGVATSNPQSYTQVKNALIAFNTIVDCPSSLIVGSGGGTLIPADSTIANNIIYHPSGRLIQHVASPTNFVYSGNVLSGASVGIEEPALKMTDPKLIKDEAGIYWPSEESPARNGAVMTDRLAEITHDISGNSRSGTRDVGAQVVRADAKRGRPLTEKDAGPLWMR